EVLSGAGMEIVFYLGMKIVGVLAAKRAFLQSGIHVKRHCGRRVRSVQVGACPQFPLSQRKHGAAAARTNILIVGEAIDSLHVVTKPELMFHLFQIVDVHARSEAMSATR